jgi:hypothetical protein
MDCTNEKCTLLKEHTFFMKKVMEMREAQKAFYKNRHQTNLEKAKILESEVDYIADNFLKAQIPLFV